MRRVLLVAVVAVPVVVLAAVSAQPGQVVETTNFNSASGASYINALQCAGTVSSNPLKLEWQIQTLSGAFTSNVNAAYKIFATNQAPAAAATGGGTFCAELSAPNANPVVYAGQVGESFPATLPVLDEPLSGSDAVKAATPVGTGCVDGQVVYICAHMYAQDGTTRLGFATGKFLVQLTAPGVPTGVTAGSGDGRLSVSWAPGTGGATTDHYVAQATPVAGGNTIFSANSTATSTTISGLQNGTAYNVGVIAYSVGGNPSTLSQTVIATPMPGADFWEVYKDAGGTEGGGCASGAAGALALLGTASLLALRRRKP
jgi:hypothetical protein